MTIYQLSGSHIVHQNIDNEIIIVNLSAGAYFSLTGAGTVVWELLLAGRSAPQVVQSLSARHISVPADLSASVDKFIQSLLEERLIMPASKMTNEIATIAQTDPAPLCPFEPIKMEKFTDMAEALIFDPVHDFDNNGWPVVRVEGTHPLIAEISTKILP